MLLPQNARFSSNLLGYLLNVTPFLLAYVQIYPSIWTIYFLFYHCVLFRYFTHNSYKFTLIYFILYHIAGLLDWKAIMSKTSWGVILLLGGGYALADVSKVISASFDFSSIIEHWLTILIYKHSVCYQHGNNIIIRSRLLVGYIIILTFLLWQ